MSNDEQTNQTEAGSSLPSKPGEIVWTDLTIPNATEISKFYEQVVGWKPIALSVGDYDDYNMVQPGSDRPIAGICHRRSSNAGLPPVWLIYIAVENLDERVAVCTRLGGKVIDGPRDSFCILQDPAGVYFALYQQNYQKKDQ